MIFRPDMVELIRNRKKTEARYPIAKTLKVQPHKHYAAQPDREPAPCRIWITDVYVQLFDDLEHQDVMRDGFHNLEQFLEHWRERFGQDIDWGHRMRVVRFELYKGQDKVPKPPRDVVSSFRGPMDPGAPATESTMARSRAPEAEKVSAETVNEYVKENWTRFDASRGDLHAKRELNRLGRSVREEGIRAFRRGVDVSAQLTNIQRELDAIRERAA